MFDKILLPVDINHAESWEKALPMALRCAGTSGEIHVLGIVHDLGSAMVSSYLPEGFEKTAMERLKADLLDFARKEFSDPTRVEVHVGHGHVPETILRIADDLGADLIVMASHPPNELKTLLIGSNADKVVRHANIPVLVAR
jgi:nucleotide-binding universal stress UspA family protein